MGEEIQAQQTKQEQKKIILPKEVQKELMKIFLRTSIPRKKRLEEQARLSNTKDRSEE